MKLPLSLLLLLFCAHFSYATNYYLSSVSGNDANNGTSESTPWKTIDKLNASSTLLKPGDFVLFKRGETFYGTITPKVSGVSGMEIYYGAYGSGVNPVISGFVTLSKWTLSSTGIYYATLDMPNLQLITINGEARGMGRYPNTGYLNYENNNGNKSITDNELPGTPSWTGAEVVIRKLRFILDRHAVTKHTGGTLTYGTSTTNGNNNAYNPVKGNGYFLQNHLKTLDRFGEWYYDSRGKRLYVFFGSNAPSSYVVKASTKESNISVSTLSYLKFANLDCEGGNVKGLNLVNVTNTVVENCNFYNQGGMAIYGIDLNGVTISGGSINNAFSSGIKFEYNTNNCTVNGVSVNNTNTMAGTARSGDASGIGIMVYGDKTTITNNRVTNTGYSAIHFIGNNVLAERNYVDRFCTIKDDGGGIYTYTGSSTTINTNRKIKNNIILNGIGAYTGAEAYHYEAFGKAAGIYLDEYANALEATENIIGHGDWGGFVLHNTHTSIISNNLIFNFRDQVHVTQYAAATRNNTVTGNQFIARQSSQNTFLYKTFVDDNPSTMGFFDRNYYARPIDDNTTIRMDNNWTGGNGTSYISLEQWKALYGLDANSGKSPITYTANIDDNLRFEYNETNSVKPVILETGYADVKGNHYSGTINLNPFEGLVLLKKLNQVIAFSSLENKKFGDAPFLLNATASSGLPVSFRVVSGPATISDNTLTITGAGSVTIEASQSGSVKYNAATPVTQSFEVAKADQLVSFPAISDKTYGDPDFALNATATSGLAVSYSVSGPATIQDNLLTITGAGLITVEASQVGNENYKAAPSVQQSFTVAKADQSITFPEIPNKTYGDAPFTISASASSGLAVSYSVVSGPATISVDTVTLTDTGTVIIEALQTGDHNYNAATPVRQQFEVLPATTTEAAKAATTSIEKSNLEGTVLRENIQITAFPNPMRGQGTVQVQVMQTTTGHIAVYNSEGKLVKQIGQRQFQKGNPTLLTLDVQHLKSGLYFIRFSSQEGIVYKILTIL